MSFAVEVPGEANPLTLEDLCRALQSATSNDTTQRQAAGQQLSAWEQAPGYYSSLQVRLLSTTAGPAKEETTGRGGRQR